MANELDPTDIHAHDALVQEAARASALEHRVEADDFRWLMQDKRGRRQMWRLISMTGVYRCSFTGNSHTFFNEGQRNVGLQLVAKIHEFCPDQYAAMLKECR